MKSETDDKIIRVKVSPVYERRIAYLENLMVVECDGHAWVQNIHFEDILNTFILLKLPKLFKTKDRI
jgi:hypothetical protein